MSGLLNIFPFSTTLLCLCLYLCLWPPLATIVSAFQGSTIPGTVTSIDQNHVSVLLVLLLSQVPWVPLPGPQREEAGTQLAATAPAQPPEQAGPRRSRRQCPEKCKQDVCVIAVSTVSFHTTQVKLFISSCHFWQAFLKLTDSSIGPTRKFRQTPGDSAFLQSCLSPPELSQPFYTHFSPRDRKPCAMYSKNTPQLTMCFFPPETNFFGASIVYGIIEQ